MGFSQAIASGFQNYVNFSGRACRSEYWFWTLFAVLISIAANILDALATGGLAALVVGLGLLLPGVAMGIRRLHDIDYSGWWILLVLTGIGAIVLLVFACLEGTIGPNRFGPDPLASLRK